MLRAGKTLCVIRVDIFDEKRHLAATSIVTYLLLG
jgi:acyl-coenzyme A thioesterase PaaI-like protein